MYFDFCVSKDVSPEQRMGLNTIFHILGDQTYRTPHKEITAGKTYFVYTIQGTGMIWYDGNQFEVAKGDCIFMKPTQDFGYRCKEDIWHFWWFETTVPPALFLLNQIYSTATGDCKEDLFAESLTWAKQDRWDIAENLYDAACGILHHALSRKKEPDHTALFYVAEQFIRENLSTVTVKELCAVLQVKERTLRNTFYLVRGHGPKHLIDSLRLYTAQQMLESTVLPIAEIAQQMGYSSQFHFSRAFKQSFGVSPRQHRDWLYRAAL